jgi:hypothetical protein
MGILVFILLIPTMMAELEANIFNFYRRIIFNFYFLIPNFRNRKFHNIVSAQVAQMLME